MSVRPAPLREVLPVFSLIAAPWGLVVVGRGVCLLAQRVPLLVLVVRAVRVRQQERYRRRSAAAPRGTAG